MKRLDLWFDYSCPYAYLASTQVEALAKRTGAELVWRPMLLGGVFRAVGTPQKLSNVLSPPKARHNLLDMTRWAAHFGVPLTMPAAHPFRTVEALRATLLTGIDPSVIHGFYRAYWARGEEVSAPATMRRVLAAAGHDAEAILGRLDEAREDLRVRTEEAIALGIFGAPAFVVGGELFWGQDRLHFVERALGQQPASASRAGLSPRGLRAIQGGMAHTLELYFDFSSPFAYLGATQAQALAERTGAELVWRPMLLGGLFRAIGQADVPLAAFSPAKQKYIARDMDRWAEYWGVRFRFPTRFPMNTVKALRAYLVLPPAEQPAFALRTFEAYWADDRDIADDAVLAELIGQSATEVLAKCTTQPIKDALKEATERAVRAGVFGAPTWVVDGTELFWGQDRINLVERALGGTPRY